jgi:D-serine deaminase-like pyridoxal phosphate-dependent protein
VRAAEHGLINLGGSRRRPRNGEVLAIVPNHVCLAVNLYETVTVHGHGSVRAVWARRGVRQGWMRECRTA